MAVDDIVGMHIVGRYQSQNIVNNLHFKITAQDTTEDLILNALCILWDTTLTTEWLSHHIDTYSLIGIKAFNKEGVAKRPGFKSIGSPGTVVGSEVPSPVCRVLTLYTDSAKYRRRGRVQLSGADTTMFNDTDGAVTDAEITSLGDLADLLAAEISDGNDTFFPCLPANLVDPVESVVAVVPRKTPSLISSRRVRQFLIG